jgi:hypothetical protein
LSGVFVRFCCAASGASASIWLTGRDNIDTIDRNQLSCPETPHIWNEKSSILDGHPRASIKMNVPALLRVMFEGLYSSLNRGMANSTPPRSLPRKAGTLLQAKPFKSSS